MNVRRGFCNKLPKFRGYVGIVSAIATGALSLTLFQGFRWWQLLIPLIGAIVGGFLGAPLERFIKRLWSSNVEGSRSSEFYLFEAACLLSGSSPQWPLPSLQCEEEYNHLFKLIRDGVGGGKLAHESGWREAEGTLHELIVTHKHLRKYLEHQQRPVPAFLHNRFDSQRLPKKWKPFSELFGSDPDT